MFVEQEETVRDPRLAVASYRPTKWIDGNWTETTMPISASALD